MENYSKVAASWWADKIRNVSPKNFDNGDDSQIGFMTMLMASMLADEEGASSESINLFEELLSRIIQEEVEKSGSITLSVDYAPNYYLGKAATDAGVSFELFPWKTVMWVYKDEIKLRDGYGAQITTI